MTTIDKIRAEIKKLQDIFVETAQWMETEDEATVYSMCAVEFGDELLSFLDTLETVSDCHDLEEAADEWCKTNNKGIALCADKKSHYLAEGIDAFIAGAEWQKKQIPMPEDTVIFNKGVEEGKRLMMEGAVAVEVVGEKRDLRLIDSTQRCLFDAKRGDWLKIIIVKEDE